MQNKYIWFSQFFWIFLRKTLKSGKFGNLIQPASLVLYLLQGTVHLLLLESRRCVWAQVFDVHGSTYYCQSHALHSLNFTINFNHWVLLSPLGISVLHFAIQLMWTMLCTTWQAMVDVAKDYGADAVAHGCTGKGNDQVSSHLEVILTLIVKNIFP